MNRNFDFYLKNIIKIENSLTTLQKNKILEFYNKYKNTYEFDNLMNVNCKNCENSFCCLDCENCPKCDFRENCKNIKYCSDCKFCNPFFAFKLASEKPSNIPAIGVP